MTQPMHIKELRELLERATPGPWQVNHLNTFQVDDADGEGRGCSPIAKALTPNGGGGEARAEARANAALMATSPDLAAAYFEAMEALDDVTAMLELFERENPDRVTSSGSAYIGKCRAVLKKAGVL